MSPGYRHIAPLERKASVKDGAVGNSAYRGMGDGAVENSVYQTGEKLTPLTPLVRGDLRVPFPTCPFPIL